MGLRDVPDVFPCVALPAARLHRLRPLIWLLFGACWLLSAQAAPAGAASGQAALDRAVAAYDAGHLPAARQAFEALARRHVPAAEYNLAVMHLRGEVPRPDPALALRLLERAGRGGFVTAQRMLGQGLESGELAPKDLVRAHDWYLRAAQAGDTASQLDMGTAYYLGRGRAHDPAQAAHWFRKAATAGDVGAMYLLASMYEQGDGLPQDLRLARYWYAAAAAQGDPAAPDKVRELDAKAAKAPG